MKNLNYLPVQIVTIPPGKTIPFDLYFKRENEYIKYLNRGHQVAEQDLDHLKKENVPRLYIATQDEDNYTLFVDELMKPVTEGPVKKAAKEKTANNLKSKMEISPEFQGIMNMMSGAFSDDKGSPKTVTPSKTLVGTVELLKKNPQKIATFYGRRVGAIATIIEHAQTMFEWSFPLSQEVSLTEKEALELSLAAALCDCGMQKLKEQDTYLFVKKYETLNSFEKRTLSVHLQAGVELAKAQKFFSPEIGELILHHEENLKGTGPLGIKELSLSQELLSLLNTYELYTRQVHNLNDHYFPEFKEKFKGYYSKNALNALGRCLFKLKLIELNPHEQLRMNEVA